VPAPALTGQLRRARTIGTTLDLERWDLVHTPGRDGDSAPERTLDITTPSPERRSSQGLRIVLQVSRFPWGEDPAAWLAGIARAADETGFAGIALMDHLIQIPQVDRAGSPISEPWVTLGPLAGLGTGLSLGTLVTFRPAGITAKAYDGELVQLPETTSYPRPVGRIPILVGGGGERRTLPSSGATGTTPGHGSSGTAAGRPRRRSPGARTPAPPPTSATATGRWPTAVSIRSSSPCPTSRVRRTWPLSPPSLPRARSGHLSSVLERPRTRRATISCWICWVPSKMSRILESRAHFSSSSDSL
jgi:hypothetical protein